MAKGLRHLRVLVSYDELEELAYRFQKNFGSLTRGFSTLFALQASGQDVRKRLERTMCSGGELEYGYCSELYYEEGWLVSATTPTSSRCITAMKIEDDLYSVEILSKKPSVTALEAVIQWAEFNVHTDKIVYMDMMEVAERPPLSERVGKDSLAIKAPTRRLVARRQHYANESSAVSSVIMRVYHKKKLAAIAAQPKPNLP